jgi:hypothetical protein
MVYQLLNGDSFNAFEPDNPVDPRLFAGRKRELATINQALVQTLKRRSRHILVRAERWLGKTSLADYIKESAPNVHKLASIDEVSFEVVFRRFGSCVNLDEAALLILNDFKTMLGSSDELMDYVKQIKGLTIGPLGIEFSGEKEINLRLHLSEMVIKLLKQYGDEEKAYLYILDETRQLSHIPGSANLLKDLLEALNQERLRNVMFLITVTPQDDERFRNDHESFQRLFRYVELGPLTDEESRGFLHDTLAKHCVPNLKIEEATLYEAARLSSGFPGFLQEIGFWLFEVGKKKESPLSEAELELAVNGNDNTIQGALDALYRKHFKHDLEGLTSEQYEEILSTIANYPEPLCPRRPLLDRLDISAQALTVKTGELIERGILIKEGGGRKKPISYAFRNPMHRTIYQIQSAVSRKKGSR